jgi:hypothetical protein
MSLLRNSVIVGGATFLVGSAFMEIGKADSKSDIGKWPYVATFLSGALGFYLLKQNFIPVPKALELNADYTDSDSSHFGKPLEDDEEFTTMQVRIGSPSGSTTSWTTAFNVECIGDEDNLYHLTYDLEYEIKDRVRQWNPNTIEDPRNPPSKTTMQIVIGSPSGSTTSWYRAFEVLAHDEMYGEDLSYLSGEIQDLVVERVKRWNGDEVIYDAEYMEEELMVGSHDFDDGSMMVGIGTNVDDPDFMEMMIDADGDIEYFSLPIGEGGWMRSYKVKPSHYGKLKTQNETNDTAGGDFVRTDGDGKYAHPMIPQGQFNAESTSNFQSFAAEVFEADRKIRRRTRWTWTRGQESGFDFEDIYELPYDIDYTGEKGRGWRAIDVPLYSLEDSYHISDLPEGYHLHLYKPSVRSGQWRAFSKSPASEDWNEYKNYKKSNLTGELLKWYNQDIAKPEEKTLSPIEKLMISKGLKSGTIQIERVVIPSTKYTPEKVQYFALGGPQNMSPTNICEIEGGVISLESLRSNEPNLFAFAQGLKFMTEKAGTLRSVNRFNKDPEAWVKSYPAWFQNAVKNKLTDIDVQFKSYTEYDGGISINNIKVLKFLNGVDRHSWRPINESERKMIDTPYGEMPQFEIYELDMNDPAPITPRPSTMRKIYAKSFKQNLSGDWKFDEGMFMMAVVDKYKFENGGSEKIHNSMFREPIYSIDIIPYMTPMAELMARRFKKKE